MAQRTLHLFTTTLSALISGSALVVKVITASSLLCDLFCLNFGKDDTEIKFKTISMVMNFHFMHSRCYFRHTVHVIRLELAGFLKTSDNSKYLHFHCNRLK